MKTTVHECQRYQIMNTRSSKYTVSNATGSASTAEPVVETPSIENNLAALLDQQAAANPAGIALIQGSKFRQRAIDYTELAAQVALRASFLHQHGLQAGDIVLMLEPMSIELYVSILAVFRMGGTVLVVDSSQGLHMIERAALQMKVRAVIASGKGVMAALSSRAVRRLSLKFSERLKLPGWISLPQGRSGEKPEAPVPVRASHPALITFTSGTTSDAKVILRSHQFLRRQLCILQETIGAASPVTELTSLPIFVLANLASSITTVLPDVDMAVSSRFCGNALVRQIGQYQPQRILGSPSFIESIVLACQSKNLSFDFVRQIHTGGGPVFPGMLNGTRRVFPNAEIVVVYGSSEAEPIAKMNFDDITEQDLDAIKEGAGLPVGMPIKEIDIRIIPLVSKEGKIEHPDDLTIMRHVCESNQIGLNQVGEILVSGEHVVQNYFGECGESDCKPFIEGKTWHRTGDIGYLDKQGRLWLTGRMSKSQREDTLFSQCMEAAVLFDDRIGGAACLRRSNRTVVFIELSPDCSSFELWSLQDRLSWMQRPDVRIVKRIPRDRRHNTKVLYKKLPA